MSDDIGEAIGGLVVIVLVTTVVVLAAIAFAAAGGVFGAGSGIVNYVGALRRNTSFEKPTP